MEHTNTDLQNMCDTKQMAIIGKLHNMQWLKSNSQLSGHTKTLPDETELLNNSSKNKINEEAKERVEIVLTDSVSNVEIGPIDKVSSKSLNEGNSIIDKEKSYSSLESVHSPQKKMETVLNKDVNVPSVLFSNSEPLVMQRLDEQPRIGITLAESIVAGQLDQLELNEEEQNKSNDSHTEAGNEWNNIHHIPDLVTSNRDVDNQLGPKQCHDNNNNNAKSKSQSVLETKKSVQKTTKVNIKKSNEQKIKKQPSNTSKEPYNISKQCSKSKDDSLNLCNDDSKTSTHDSKKLSVGISPKFIDKYSKVNGCNKQLIVGKGARIKEQPLFRPHFSTFNDSGNNSKSSIEGSDEKVKYATTKLKVSMNESDIVGIELDDSKKCHKVQVARSQSYSIQYNRSKPLIKSQQRYLKSATKPEELNSIKNTSGFTSANVTISNSTENLSKKRCENQQNVLTKQINDTQSSHNISGKSIKNLNIAECGTSEKNSSKLSSVSCKRNYQNLAHTKNNIERSIRDDQGHTQKFKRDSNIYRRSSTVTPTFLKEVSGKTKTEDIKKNVMDNNAVKDHKTKPISTVNAKVYCESEDPNVFVHTHKTSNGANNTNKTDTLDSPTVNNVQSVKSLNSCLKNTKDSTTVSGSEELQISQVSCNKTEVQFVKTEQENISNNNSNNKTNTGNSDTKSVKFSDNIQEIKVTQRTTPSYSDNSMEQKTGSTNAFYSNLQNISNTSNAQQMENYQSVQNKSYFDNVHNNAQCSNITTNIQHAERNLHLDVMQQNPEQTLPISPHNNGGTNLAMGNTLPYQNMPATYLSQYNNTQSIPRKTTGNTVTSQNALISSSSYNVESQNVMQNDPSNVPMHNSQTSVLPPTGFHNHPITSQPSQWNLPIPDMYLLGNMLNPANPMNMQIQNSRPACGTDFNNMQQSGYLQQPLFYVPAIQCMQSWNPLLQYPAPLFQNPLYANCNTYSNQVLSSNNLVDSVNCPVPTSIQNNPYKHFQPVQQLENPPNFSAPVKLDSYMGNIQNCKSNHVRMKDNLMDAQMRANQYRASVPNEYQNCSQDAQLMVPFTYGITMDSIARNGSPNIYMQMNQKYAPRALSAANYQRMSNTCSTFQNNQDSNNKKDDVSKNESECIPPIVSPRECMYYGMNYSGKTDNVQSSSLRSDVKPVTYNVHSVNAQHYTSQFHRNTTYNASSKELSSRVTMGGRGIRKTMEH